MPNEKLPGPRFFYVLALPGVKSPAAEKGAGVYKPSPRGFFISLDPIRGAAGPKLLPSRHPGRPPVGAAMSAKLFGPFSCAE